MSKGGSKKLYSHLIKGYRNNSLRGRIDEFRKEYSEYRRGTTEQQLMYQKWNGFCVDQWNQIPDRNGDKMPDTGSTFRHLYKTIAKMNKNDGNRPLLVDKPIFVSNDLTLNDFNKRLVDFKQMRDMLEQDRAKLKEDLARLQAELD